MTIDNPVLSAPALKPIFAHIPTSVSIVTMGSGAERYGVTIGTLGVLSLDPPLLMFAMKQDSGLLRRIDAGTPVGINVLAEDQQEIARRFSTPSIDRFGVTRWCEQHSLPRIDDTLAWLTGHVRDRLFLGDHMLITVAIGHAENEDQVPLLYWRRQFYSIEAIDMRGSSI